MTRTQAGVIILLLMALIVIGALVLIEIDDLQTTLRLMDVACPEGHTTS